MIITAELVAQAGQMGLVTQREIGDGLVGVRELDGDRLLTVTVHSHPVAYVRREPTTSASTDGTLVEMTRMTSEIVPRCVKTLQRKRP